MSTNRGRPEMRPGRPLVSRRRAIGAAAATALAAGGATLAACGPATNSATAPKPTPAAANVYVLGFRPGFIRETTIPLMEQTWQPWLAKNSGVQVRLMPGQGRQGAMATAIIAGTAPDVFADWVLPIFTSAGLVLDLTKYVRSDNVDLSAYPSLLMQYFEQGGGLWGVPSYMHLTAPAVNLGVLDSAGVAYPESGWTYTQWEQLWRKVAVHSAEASKTRLGYHFSWDGYDYSGANPQPHYLKGFGGEYVSPDDRSRCYLDSAGSVQCLKWIYGLLQDHVAAPSGGNFATGSVVVDNFATNVVAEQVVAWRSAKWQIYDEPLYPVQKTAYGTSDFFAVSATSRRPDIAWEFFKFVAVQPTWQREMMHLIGMGPNQKSLWPEWVQILRQVAPPLADKDLEAFVRQVQSDQPYFGLTFAYDDSAAGGVINRGLAPAQRGQATVAKAAQGTARQVDALETAAAAEQGRVTAARNAFPTRGPAIAPVPSGI